MRYEICCVVEICEVVEVEMCIILSYYEVVGGVVEVNCLCEVCIEDFLGCELIEVDELCFFVMIDG